MLASFNLAVLYSEKYEQNEKAKKLLMTIITKHNKKHYQSYFRLGMIYEKQSK